MKRISVLVKPASSLCNIRCKYCFYANVCSLREVVSYGKMTEEVLEKMISNIYIDLEDGDSLTLAFQGGEPTLAGLPFYEKVVKYVQKQTKKVSVNYVLQTNGMIITEKWCQFLRKHQFLVGLSIDGTACNHDQNRVDSRGRGTFKKVARTKYLFDKYNIEYNVLCVLTEELAYLPNQVFDFLLEEDIKYIQFIPCLDDLDAKERGSFALTPKSFTEFYNIIFKRWLTTLQKGQYISIKLFDDIWNLLVRRELTSCGIAGNCQLQYVIESDGSVYPCDFYVLDEYKMGNICEETLRQMFSKPISRKFLCEKKEYTYCKSCPFIKICNGGCKRMKNAMYVDDEGNFCGYQQLLGDFIPSIPEIRRLVSNCKR